MKQFSDLDIKGQRQNLPPLNAELGILVKEAGRNFLFHLNYASPTAVHLPIAGLGVQSDFGNVSEMNFSFKMNWLPESQVPINLSQGRATRALICLLNPWRFMED